ncbi:MAG: hypothetical protein HY879_27085 [Deltaproteobacteria bacterium]|nr:hypothetical protein [Deltaproteobacteria bacterium]
MTTTEKLIEKVRGYSISLNFEETCLLAEKGGFFLIISGKPVPEPKTIRKVA